MGGGGTTTVGVMDNGSRSLGKEKLGVGVGVGAGVDIRIS